VPQVATEEFLRSPDRSYSHCCIHFACHPYYLRERLSNLSSSGATPPQFRRIHVPCPQPLIERLPCTASPSLAATEPPYTFDCTLQYPRPPISTPIPTLTPLALSLSKQLTGPLPKVLLNILQRPRPPLSPSQHQSLELLLKKPHIMRASVSEVLVVFGLWLNSSARSPDTPILPGKSRGESPAVSQLIVDLRNGYESVACEAQCSCALLTSLLLGIQICYRALELLVSLLSRGRLVGRVVVFVCEHLPEDETVVFCEGGQAGDVLERDVASHGERRVFCASWN
jgi:hypothetical protein